MRFQTTASVILNGHPTKDKTVNIFDIKFDSLQKAVSYDLETAGGLAIKRVPAALLHKKGLGYWLRFKKASEYGKQCLR